MMNMNKWTMALAAAGVVSLSSVAQAQEAAAGADVVAASVELSGYVSSSYTMGSNRPSTANTFRGSDGNADKFSLDVVSLSLSGAKGEGEWASGYNFTMWIGDAASDIGTSSASDNTLEVMEANIELTLPVGTGLNLTVGQMGTVVGYETYDYTANAFHNRGWAFAAEPTHHTGVLAEYQLNDNLGVKAGVVNDTTSAQTNATNDAGGVAYLLGADYAPSEGTWLGDNGFDLSAGAVLDAGASATQDRDTMYVAAGLPINGMIANLTADVAATYAEQGESDTEIYQVYLAYSLSENTTINARYEFGDDDITASKADIESWAVGVTHNLWENVTSRVEYMTSDWEGATNDDEALTISLIYSF